MTQEQIKEFNELCAEFLGYKLITPKMRKYPEKWTMSYWQKDYPEKQDVLCSEEYLSFDTDWNWIMRVKEKITSLKIIDEFNTKYDSIAKGFSCNLLPVYKNSFELIYTNVLQTEKEATIEILYQFLKWYKENKQL